MPILSAYVVAVGTPTRVRFHFDPKYKKILNSVAVSVTTRPFLDLEVVASDKTVPIDGVINPGDQSAVFTNERLGLYIVTGEGVWVGQCKTEFKAVISITVYETVAADIIRADINFSEEGI